MQTDFTWNPTLVEESQILNGDEFYDFRNSDGKRNRSGVGSNFLS